MSHVTTIRIAPTTAGGGTMMRKAQLKINVKGLVILVSVLLSACSGPGSVKKIDCKNTEIRATYEDGTVVLVPANSLGADSFTWDNVSGTIEVEVMGSFNASGEYNKQLIRVPVKKEGGALLFQVPANAIFPEKRYVIQLSARTYSSEDLSWQQGPDGQFKFKTIGQCDI
jgi:hypothetical protein